MGKKVGTYTNSPDLLVYCPACKMPHVFDKRWTFNGDFEKPTFRASMLVRYSYGELKTPTVCHSYVTDGRWEYLSDCTHAMKGMTVDVPDFDTWLKSECD
jgi:hypothetical protein